MARGPITKASVDDVPVGTTDAYLWDDDLPGFGVKVTPSGKRTYFVQYRIGGRKGRTRRVTVGRHGVVTAKQARDAAKQLLGEAQAGRDPAAQRDGLRGAETLGQVLKRFLDAHVDAKLKRSTAAEYRRLMKIHVPHRLRNRLLLDVTRDDLARLHAGLADKPYQANRVLAIFSKFFNWCERNELRPDNSNPCRHIQKYRESSRERFLLPNELQRLAHALEQAEASRSCSPWMVGAIRLLLFTGARLSEILTLRWEYVDLAGRHIRLPDSKTGRKSIYLNSQALAVLTALPRIAGNPHAICGEKAGQHLVNLQKPWRRIRAAAGLTDVRIHDLRHTYASWGAMRGLALPVIGALLSHSQPQTTDRYAHHSADPLKAATELVGDAMESAMGLERNAR